MDEPIIHYEYPVFPDQTTPNGKLMSDKACQAAWYYYALAHKVYAQTKEGEFGLLEGSPWLDPTYEQLAYSVATIYGLSGVDEFMKFVPIVMLECERLGMMSPQRVYLKPRKLM